MEKQGHSRNQLSRSPWAFHKHEFNGWGSLALYQVVWLAVCLIQMDAFEMEVLAMKSSVRHLQQVLALSFKIYIYIYLVSFIWLHQVLVAACRIFSCSMYHLVP